MFVKRLITAVVTLGLLGVAAASLTACGSKGKEKGTQYVVTVNMDTATAPFFVTHDAGAGKEYRYGSAQLVGSSEFAGKPVSAELLAVVNYKDGNGPFVGFWTFTAENGDSLAFTYTGTTTQRDGVGRISGKVQVLAGTGQYVGVTGSGDVTGVRDGSLGSGSVIAYTLELTLEGVL